MGQGQSHPITIVINLILMLTHALMLLFDFQYTQIFSARLNSIQSMSHTNSPISSITDSLFLILVIQRFLPGISSKHLSAQLLWFLTEGAGVSSGKVSVIREEEKGGHREAKGLQRHIHPQLTHQAKKTEGSRNGSCSQINHTARVSCKNLRNLPNCVTLVSCPHIFPTRG